MATTVRSGFKTQATAAPARRKYMTWPTLALMTVSVVASLRAAPSMAIFGLASIFLYIVPAIFFFIPTSLIPAELASGWKGGVYNWVSQGMNSRWGLLAVWAQFAQTIFYYPTVLAYVATNFAYIIDPKLASNGIYIAAMLVVLYWGSVVISGRGLKTISSLASKGTVIGTLIPGLVLVGLAIAYVLQGNSSAAPMNVHHILPVWAGIGSIVLIVNNFLSYDGMEVNAVHVDELRDPQREYPKSIFLAMILVLCIFIFPALAISWVIPSQQISLTAGVMQAFTAIFAHFSLSWAVPLIALALIIANMSGMISWLAGPSKGLVMLGRQYGYLPRRYQHLNADGIQTNILVAQGYVITIIAVLYALVPAVSSAYWIFTVMTTSVYLIMYILMFIAAVNLRRRYPDHPRGYKAPLLKTQCWVGGIACVLAILIGFVPPSQFGHTSPVLYALLILIGIVVIGVLPAFLLDRYRKPSWKTVPDADVDPAVALTEARAHPSEASELLVDLPRSDEQHNGAGRASHGPAAPAPSASGGTPHPPSGPGTVAAPGPSSTAQNVTPEELPTLHGLSDRRRHRAVLWAIAALLVILAVVLVLVYKPAPNNSLAQAKAHRVEALYAAHGLTVPVDDKTLISILGTNGGSVCASPTSALTKAMQDLSLANGGATVGIRPIQESRRVVEGEQIILQVYCPKQVPAFNKYVNAKRYDAVTRK
ncbi:MAG: amino acid permease [Solirubrobacteraceae bacterium]